MGLMMDGYEEGEGSGQGKSKGKGKWRMLKNAVRALLLVSFAVHVALIYTIWPTQGRGWPTWSTAQWSEIGLRLLLVLCLEFARKAKDEEGSQRQQEGIDC